MAELFKYDELRLKTEVQLIRLIHNELDRGIRCARQALSATRTKAIAEEWKLRAERACTEASRLIPLAVEMSQDQRTLVKSKLEQLRAMLQTMTSIGAKRAPSENDIAVLASVN